MKNKDILLRGIVFLVLGILLCIGVSGNDIIGWVLSISLLVGAAALLAAGFYVEKTMIGSYGTSGGILLAAALILMPPIALFKSYYETISMLMIVFGALFLLDGLLSLAKKRNLIMCVTVLVLGAILFTFGMLLWFNVGDMQRFASLIIGVVFIVYAALLLVSGFTGKNVIPSKGKKK